MPRRTGGFIGHRGLQAPDPPTAVTAPTSGDAQAIVSFTAPSDVGDDAITGFVVTTADGIGVAGSSSPITVTGLTNGTEYTFRAIAINDYGTSAPSVASSAFTPVAPRAVFAGGLNASGTIVNTMDFIEIAATGNAQDFGDLTTARSILAGMSSATRGCFGGGDIGGNTTNVIDYVTIASAGNAQDFGDLTATGDGLAGTAAVSSTTRGVRAGGGGYSTQTNIMDYITIASTGNATDFGDYQAATSRHAGCQSTTRGIFGGGRRSGGLTNQIEYITIANTGNTSNFGNLSASREHVGALSSSTRGIFFGGEEGSAVNKIEYVTIGSTGNTTDFGDLLQVAAYMCGTSNGTRGIMAGNQYNLTGNQDPEIIQYITISSTGNATDFGNRTGSLGQQSACVSGNHGGIA